MKKKVVDFKPQVGKIDPLSLLAILITLVFWASAFAGIRAGLEFFTPGHLTLYRFLVASIAIIIFILVKRIPLPSSRDLLQIFLLSLSGITFYHVLLNYGQVNVPAGTASLIVATGPIITAVLATRFAGEKLNYIGWLGTMISLSGVILIVLGRGNSVEFTQGALLIVAAAFFTSIYFVFQRSLLKRMSSLHFTVWSLLLGTLPMLVFIPGFLNELLSAPLKAHLSLIYLGLFPSVIGYLTWTFAISRIGSSAATSFLYISPVIAIFIGWLWLGEIPKLITLLGGSIAVLGVILVNLRGRPNLQKN